MTSNFKVLIVGGSVAGLSLAHCLKRLGVSFTILEQGNEIAPQLGASIGILPNGGRILDQLGIFADVEREIEPLEIARIRYPDGFWFESRYPQALQSNYGYPVSFLERQKFLDILHKTLGSDDCIHTNKKVVAVENGQDKAVVKTLDGAEYAADLVVGADGVHSVVRSEVWRHLTETAQVSATDDPNEGIKYEYACIYGMSFDVPNIQLGVQLSRLDDGVSIHTFTGKQSKLFWFIIIKTDQGNCADKVRYSTQTARDVCDGLRSKALTDNLTFGDVWSRCTIFKMTPLQEGVFKHWNHGRLVCIGDAVRKMTPNIGQGANMAIEDAARLASLLDKGLSRGDLSAAAVDSMLRDFTAAQSARTKSICAQAEFLVRMHANQGIGRRILGRHLIPFLSDAPAGLSGLSISGAAKIDFVDLPIRSLDGAWEASWASTFRSLPCMVPNVGLVGAMWLVGGLIVACLVVYRRG